MSIIATVAVQSDGVLDLFSVAARNFTPHHFNQRYFYRISNCSNMNAFLNYLIINQTDHSLFSGIFPA